MVALTQIGPSVVLATAGIPTLPVEIVGEAEAPYPDDAEHNPLTIADGNGTAVTLVVEEVQGIESGEEGPSPIYPGILSGDLGEDEADGS